MSRFYRTAWLLIAVLIIAVPLSAAPVPSKTAATQTIAQRDADLATVRALASADEVAAALEAQGFTREEVDSRLAALAPDELRSLAQNVEQIQAAGLTREQWMWIGVGALAVLLLLALT